VGESRRAEPTAGERPEGSLDGLDLRARSLEREGANATCGRGGGEVSADEAPAERGSLQRELDLCERLLEDCRREWAAAGRLDEGT
jgi:hypothetical protein